MSPQWGKMGLLLVPLLAGCAQGGQATAPPHTVATESPGDSIVHPPPGVLPGSNSPGASSTGSISDAVVTAHVGKDGAADPAATSFDSATVSRVTLILTLQGLPSGTKLSYVRYLGGKFVDSRSAVLKHAARRFYFKFDARPGGHLKAGHYRLRVYINEHSVREVEYDVR